MIVVTMIGSGGGDDGCNDGSDGCIHGGGDQD